MSEVIIIRPHHGMCFQFYEGKGYSEEFTDHMGKVIHILEKEPDTKLKISVREDVVCGNCPNNAEGGCKSCDKVIRYDNAVLNICGIPNDVELSYRDFLELVSRKIIENGKRKDICGDCEWDYICGKNDGF